MYSLILLLVVLNAVDNGHSITPTSGFDIELLTRPFLKDPELRHKPSSNILLTLKEPLLPIFDSLNMTTFTTRESRASSLVQALQSLASIAQQPVLAALNPFKLDIQPFWITNQIFIRGASPMVVKTLINLPIIREIAEELKSPMLPIFNALKGKPPNGPEWHVKKIEATLVWENGSRGEGVTVAGIDSGVKKNHDALKTNYVGAENYGWFDPIDFSPEPTDIQGHGTHTLASMCGTNGIGIAPGAKWMACRGCLLDGCLQHALLACAQFFLCPTNPQGTNPDCSKMPHIINNSWGTEGSADWFKDIVVAWRAAGIIPFFASGNSGPGCETVTSPGDLDLVITVGSTDKNDLLSKFSSRGPVIYNSDSEQGKEVEGSDKDNDEPGSWAKSLISSILSIFVLKKKQYKSIIKPDICAPGERINSAHILGNDAYRILSGSSMAAPQVSGAAALLLSKNPKLKMKDILRLLTSTTEQQLPITNAGSCLPFPADQFPNNMFGHGRINVFKAYQKMLKEMNEGDAKTTKNK